MSLSPDLAEAHFLKKPPAAIYIKIPVELHEHSDLNCMVI